MHLLAFWNTQYVWKYKPFILLNAFDLQQTALKSIVSNEEIACYEQMLLLSQLGMSQKTVLPNGWNSMYSYILSAIPAWYDANHLQMTKIMLSYARKGVIA